MADIKVRIEVNPNQETEKLGDIVNDNAEVSNVSIKPNADNIFIKRPTSEYNGINGLSLGQDLVFNGSDYVDNQDMLGGVIESETNPMSFVWGFVPDNKKYSVKLTFTNAQNLKDIVVYGDKIVNQFPTRAIIDGTTEIFSDDYRWSINLQSASTTHTIEFTDWNRANYNATISFIGIMLRYFEVDRYNGLKSIETLSQTTARPKEVFYGIVPGDGSLQLLDLDGEIADMIKGGIIPNSNLKLDILTNGKNIQTAISTDTTYSNGDKLLSFEVSNSLNNWDNIIIPEYKNLRASNSASSDYRPSLYDTLHRVLKNAQYTESEIELMLSDEIEYEIQNSIVDNIKVYKLATIKEYLSEIKHLTFEYYPSSTLKSIVDSICAIAQLQIYEDDNGNIKFKDARPRLYTLKQREIISIPQKCQISKLESDFVPNAIYDNVTTKQNDFFFNQFEKVYSYSGEPTNISNNFKRSYDASISYEYIAFTLEISYQDLLQLDNLLKNNGSPIQAKIGLSGDKVETITISDILLSNIDIENWQNVLTQDKVSKATILSKYTTLNSYTLVIQLWSKTANASIDKIEYLDIYGVTVKFNNVDYSTNYSKNAYKFPNNIFVKKDTARQYVEIRNTSNTNQEPFFRQIIRFISDNIIEDYSKGIKTATTSIICGDYYDINGTLVKHWDIGEVIQIGDIIRIDKDNIGTSMEKYDDGRDMYFQVTGRHFKYDGVPTIDLELQEVKY